MELVEREGNLEQLKRVFQRVSKGDGQSIFVSGEAGLGKTSLIRTFCKDLQGDNTKIYWGACDALFTPRPLAPLYDIAWQVTNDFWPDEEAMEQRSSLFARFFRDLSQQTSRSVIVFEDVHWADEATLDFIRFFARRVSQIRCLFILTFRDDDSDSYRAIRNIMGQLPPDSFCLMNLAPLSREAVDRMAGEKGYRGEDVYTISGGNPFYVYEILASYSLGIPDNIRNAVLSSYDQQEGNTRQLWELLSVVPRALETTYLEKLEPHYKKAIEKCMASRILVESNGMIAFKHEIFRRTIEQSLSPLKRVALHQRILDLLHEPFERHGEIERIVHHAKNANDYDRVVRFAPAAAAHAARMGAHTQASKLYLTAIEYYQGHDIDQRLRFYEAYAYECYLTSQIKEAIIYTTRALVLWKEKNIPESIGNCLRFLSRLWWFDGHGKNAENFAALAIEVLDKEQPSHSRAMAYSNMSQLKMVSDQPEACIVWGEKAISMAEELGDQEVLAHALNNVGSVKMHASVSCDEGTQMLEKSLEISLAHGFDEHAARAYTNLASNSVEMKKYPDAAKFIEDGIRYCEERDVDSWTHYLLCYKARLCLETGNWDMASQITGSLLQNQQLLPIGKIGAMTITATIQMRRGEPDEALRYLNDAKSLAFFAREAQRIIPVLTAMLEFEWITGTRVITDDELETAIQLVQVTGNEFENGEFSFRLRKARNKVIPVRQDFAGYHADNPQSALRAAAVWKSLGCPYEEALLLFEGNEKNKGDAILIMQKLGAAAVHEKLKLDMRKSGIRKIPRGVRKSTQSNAAQLTLREIDVLQLLQKGLPNKEIAEKLFISAKTVDHHISSILFKLDVNTRSKAVQQAQKLAILK